jgi:hypothetical protein
MLIGHQVLHGLVLGRLHPRGAPHDTASCTNGRGTDESGHILSGPQRSAGAHPHGQPKKRRRGKNRRSTQAQAGIRHAVCTPAEPRRKSDMYGEESRHRLPCRISPEWPDHIHGQVYIEMFQLIQGDVFFQYIFCCPILVIFVYYFNNINISLIALLL